MVAKQKKQKLNSEIINFILRTMKVKSAVSLPTIKKIVLETYGVHPLLVTHLIQPYIDDEDFKIEVIEGKEFLVVDKFKRNANLSEDID